MRAHCSSLGDWGFENERLHGTLISRILRTTTLVEGAANITDAEGRVRFKFQLATALGCCYHSNNRNKQAAFQRANYLITAGKRRRATSGGKKGRESNYEWSAPPSSVYPSSLSGISSSSAVREGRESSGWGAQKRQLAAVGAGT